jgi:4-hydroxy-3-polyprenylbenzoate decarboxylase
MIVIPCSMGTLARIAHGLAGNLIDRAADVCLKEKRPLVLCTRETPLNRVHIRNMDWAAEAGATIYPLIPTFYNHPKSFDEMAHQFACRVLQFVGLEQKDAYRWGSEDSPRRHGGNGTFAVDHRTFLTSPYRRKGTLKLRSSPTLFRLILR